MANGAAQKRAEREQHPPPADKCRATCSHRARNVHAQEERATNPTTAAGKQGGYRAVVECACNVRATCLSPEAGTQGMKGTEGRHEANPPPPPTEREPEEPKRAGRPRREERTERERPPPPAGKCRASCLRRVRSVHAPEERQQGRPPPPLRKGTRAARGRKAAMGGGHRGEHKVGGRDGRQAVGAPGSLNPAQKLTNKMPQRGRAGGESRGKAGHGGCLGEQKGAREGGNPRVESGGGKGQHSGRGGPGRKGPKGDAGKGPNPRSLGPPPVTVSAPP